MTKKPFLNAFAALGYILIVVFIMTMATKNSGHGYAQQIIIPIFVLSLLTLSAAVMGYVFLSQPILIYLEGDKKGAVSLFVKTLGYFALITAIVSIVDIVAVHL